ncbi:uncharacterized protein LOC129757765 [Uranotaenia lowii]|uniref:uncharacterized protein LOC129757765 n=1 Tax=Uranotaenia lowii TaxID=190385 RepID=UPI0024796D10|nr:uncharacterized protein LOC129757765 [Uranotaenia lowii]
MIASGSNMWLLPSIVIFWCLSVVACTDSPLKCRHAASKNCILQNVNYVQYQRLPQLPNLADKHTLQIRSGNIVRFSKEFSDSLGVGVTKILLGRLEIKSLYVKPTWRYLSAESNKIEELIVDDLDEKLAQADEPQEDVESVTEAIEEEPRENSAESGVYEIQYLSLKDNQLRSIREVSAFRKLKELLLDRNQIDYLEMDTFRGMNLLKRLSLAENKLTHIVTSGGIVLPTMEFLSLRSNQLPYLSVKNWTMLQLTDLELSHNQLVTLDVENFDQFVSLENLAMASNRWYCFWLNKALNKLALKYITLSDHDEECSAMPIEGICCSMTGVAEDQSTFGNLFDRINNLNNAQALMQKQTELKVKQFEDGWKQTFNRLQDTVKARLKKLEPASRDTEKIMQSDVNRMLDDLDDLNHSLDTLKSLGKEHAEFERKFTKMHYMVIEAKNNLFSAMRNASKLKQEMENFEQEI